MKLDPTEDEPVIEWFYDPLPLLDTSQVNGKSYRKWRLSLAQQAVLFRLSNQLLSDLMDRELLLPPLRRSHSSPPRP